MNLITIEEFIRDEKAYLALFTRVNGVKQKPIIIGTDEFKPYFYRPASQSELDTSNGEGTFLKTIHGKLAKKIELLNYNDLVPASREYETSYEADVHYTTRYLVDKIDKIEPCDLRIHYTDIEKNPATNELISIAVYDNFLKKCVAFVWRNDLKPGQYDKEYSFPSGFSFKATIHTYNNERSLLQDYMLFVQQTDPDVLTGWFFVSYDVKEIIGEIKKVGLNPSGLSPIGKAYMIGNTVKKHNTNIAIKGRVLWDMLEGYASLQQSRLASKSLESVSTNVLGEGKHKHRNFKDIWKDIDELVEYNCKDSMLVYRIDQEKKILEYYNTMRCFVGCDWTALMHETLMWDCYILRKVHNKLALPTKRAVNIESAEGATVVKPPKKGVYNLIGLTDFMRLYPSAIITWNMSPESMVRDEPYNPETMYRLPNGVMFYKEPIGLLPSVLLELLDLRKKYKAEMKQYPVGSKERDTLDNMQYAVKVLMNALYGAMGYFNFRLATPEIVASTTLTGRLALARKMQILEQLQHTVVYGDTDSVFIRMNETELTAMITELNKLVDAINIGIKDYFEKELGAKKCFIQTEAKAIYKNLIMSEKKSGEGTAKKRYAGLRLWVEGQTLDPESDEALEIKGYEQKRSDTSQLSRDMQKELFKVILKGSSKEDVRTCIQKYVRGIKNREFPLDYIGISKGIKDLDDYKVDNPHRRGCLYSNAYLGTNYGLGDKVKIVYISTTGKYPKTDVIAFDDTIPQEFQIDISTMIEKNITNKIEHILDASGYTIEEMLNNTKSLDVFF